MYFFIPNYYPYFSPYLSYWFILFLYSPPSMILLHTSILNVPSLCSPLLPSLLSYATMHPLPWIFLKIVSKMVVQHAPNTLLWIVPSHLGVLHHSSPFLHEFWRVSLTATTSFVTYSFFQKISSMTCTVRVMSFSSVLCTAYFFIPCVVVDSPITLSASFCRGSNFSTIFFYSSHICSILLYLYLFSRMDIIYSTCGRVLMLSLVFWAWSCALLIPSLISFISGLIVSCV
jgi:hypothetical protein